MLPGRTLQQTVIGRMGCLIAMQLVCHARKLFLRLYERCSGDTIIRGGLYESCLRVTPKHSGVTINRQAAISIFHLSPACRGSALCQPARPVRAASSQQVDKAIRVTCDFSNLAGRHKTLSLHAGLTVPIAGSSFQQPFICRHSARPSPPLEGSGEAPLP